VMAAPKRARVAGGPLGVRGVRAGLEDPKLQKQVEARAEIFMKEDHDSKWIAWSSFLAGARWAAGIEE
jgi:hypothetical protein